MNEYRSNNRKHMVNTTPLFASSWLALFSVLRDNFYEPRTLSDQEKDLILLSDQDNTQVLIEDENVEKVISD